MTENEITLVVDGKEVTVDVENATSITDISEDMTTVASVLAWFGALWAAARENHQEAEDTYRAWRADATIRAIESDPKAAEWKVKQMVDASSAFASHKRSLRGHQRTVDRLGTALEAIRVKADMLRSKGANMRAELDSTNMKTHSEDGPAPKPRSGMTREERAEAVREVLGKRKNDQDDD